MALFDIAVYFDLTGHIGLVKKIEMIVIVTLCYINKLNLTEFI